MSVTTIRIHHNAHMNETATVSTFFRTSFRGTEMLGVFQRYRVYEDGRTHLLEEKVGTGEQYANQCFDQYVESAIPFEEVQDA